MARKKSEKKDYGRKPIIREEAFKPVQLQLFAAFRDIWQAPVS